jgi:hypothetical protein
VSNIKAKADALAAHAQPVQHVDRLLVGARVPQHAPSDRVDGAKCTARAERLQAQLAAERGRVRKGGGASELTEEEDVVRAKPEIDTHGCEREPLYWVTGCRQNSAHSGQSGAGHMTEHLQQSKHAHISKVSGGIVSLETNTFPVPVFIVMSSNPPNCAQTPAKPLLHLPTRSAGRDSAVILE